MRPVLMWQIENIQGTPKSPLQGKRFVFQIYRKTVPRRRTSMGECSIE